MARGRGKTSKAGDSKKRPIERYEHADKKRINNPPVGLVTPETDPVAPTHKTYEYDPHLDPQLVWAGKKEHTSFEVPTVSLHVHERIDPRTIIEAVRKRNGNGLPAQPSLFERSEEKLPLRDAVDFYKHAHGWSNRLIAGDSLLVMNSLLEKEGMAGQVQMVYIDPPYGIKYGSNFQPFVNKRDVTDGKDEDLTQEPEMIQAFRDTWELGIHSYLTFLRDRLLLARELLHESGSCFVQISDENLHHVREVMDNVFDVRNYLGQIGFRKTGSQSTQRIPSTFDYIVAYARDKERTKTRPLFVRKAPGGEGARQYTWLESPTGGEFRQLAARELAQPSLIPEKWRVFRPGPLSSPGYQESSSRLIKWDGRDFSPGANRHWSIGVEGTLRLCRLGRTMVIGNTLCSKLFLDDFPVSPRGNYWYDTVGSGFGQKQIYVVETSTTAIERCMLMFTDPGDLVLDPTCGSGTTAYVAEQWGRRWITCDTSRVAITLAKQRLMATGFDFYELAHPDEGVGSGFRYKTVPHVTLKSIADNPEIREGMTCEQIDAAIARYADQETLYDQPYVDKSRARVSGPFTVEAVPAPTVRSLEEIEESRPAAEEEEKSRSLTTVRQKQTTGFGMTADASVARKGATLRHTEWRDELLKTGIRGKGGQMINFSRVEPLAGTRWLHADAETKEGAGLKPGATQAKAKQEGGATRATGNPERVVFSFGPEHGPLEQRQVELAWEEGRTLIPKPSIIVFAAFQFDPEAAKDIDELTKDKTGMTFLTAQMNADLLTGDLKKKRASNQGFWLVGRPDVDLRRATKEEAARPDAALKGGATQAKAKAEDGERKGAGLEAGVPGGVPGELYVVEVRGFDYYNTRTGTIESGDTSKIAMWLLDTDYDGRSLYPRQVFFPMADEDEGWARLARNLKAEIDPELVAAYRGTVSLPFEAGPNKRAAVKVIDDRGIESLKVVDIK